MTAARPDRIAHAGDGMTGDGSAATEATVVPSPARGLLRLVEVKPDGRLLTRYTSVEEE